MWYYGEYSCGHEGFMWCYGKYSCEYEDGIKFYDKAEKREPEEDKHFKNVCPSCLEKQKTLLKE